MRLEIEKLLELLKTKKDKCIIIPKQWNYFPFSKTKKISENEVAVNKHEYLINLIENFYLPRKTAKEITSIAKKDWLKQASIYSIMIRTSLSYDHNGNGQLDDDETGTFLKALGLIPYLKTIGIDTLYLLPIFAHSRMKENELGSPYAVRNMFMIDNSLIEDYIPCDQFKCFMEACHLHNIHVIIDIIPRTNSIYSDLIPKHPDWFYWTKQEIKNAPYVKGLEKYTPPEKKHLKAIYENEEVVKYLQGFSKSPDPKPEMNTRNYLEVVKKEKGIVIAKAFSDSINDPQPVWSDITYFRLYLDHPTNALPYISNYNPYILFDNIKANLNPGKIPNIELWNLLSDVIPYYQVNYGIDGARIDMGHALPKELLKMIIDKAKNINPNFAFIAEELNPKNALDALKKGYDAIIGDGFMQESRIEKASDFFYSSLRLPIPVFAIGESHDTPRLAARKGGKAFSTAITILNLFMPNSIPFLNSGQEFYELTPMNTGLDTEAEYTKYPISDPYRDTLALFSKYQFHYQDTKLIKYLKEIAPIRKNFLAYITCKKNFIKAKANLIVLAYQIDNHVLLVLGNIKDALIKPEISLPTFNDISLSKAKILFSTSENIKEFSPFQVSILIV